MYAVQLDGTVAGASYFQSELYTDALLAALAAGSHGANVSSAETHYSSFLAELEGLNASYVSSSIPPGSPVFQYSGYGTRLQTGGSVSALAEYPPYSVIFSATLVSENGTSAVTYLLYINYTVDGRAVDFGNLTLESNSALIYTIHAQWISITHSGSTAFSVTLFSPTGVDLKWSL